ncbi:MAG: peptide chain release factor 2, partial [Acidimicrobiia bacterium]|nr:peptide chain release factor 2 [Acidimicrobiia bacterium]
HVPTGVVVSCQAERSQIQNRARAMVMLHAKLAELRRQETEEQLAALKGEQQEAAWGRQIRSYTMQPFQLVKDLRTGVEIGNIQAVLDGDFSPLVEAFLRWRREQKETEE